MKTQSKNGSNSRKTLVVKVTFSSLNTIDAEIIPILEKQRNKASYVRKAIFCHIKGLPNKRPGEDLNPSATRHKLNAAMKGKMSMLENPDF
ncbi:MAG: hypothetical protein A2X99_10795 [Deltaproteobacteria bacterium GWB2_55_19]|nr:MAG: hypothetical protein A2X99_10795 [Deltaproteobacteria bacterium GWB2_55_19]